MRFKLSFWKAVVLTSVAVVIVIAVFLRRHSEARVTASFEAAYWWSLTGHHSTYLIGDSRIEDWTPFCKKYDGTSWNLGIAGSTAIFWRDYLLRQSPSFPPDVHAILWLGINDIMNVGRDAQATADSLLWLIRYLSMRSLKVTVLSQIPVSIGNAERNRIVNRELERLNELVAAELRIFDNVKYISLYEIFNEAHPKDRWYRDGIHLTREGNKELCKHIYGVLS